MNEESLLPEKREPTVKSNVVYTEEDVFYGAGINSFHYTLDAKKTICGIKIRFFGNWSYSKTNYISEVDCKRCIKKLKGDINE